MRIKHFTFLLAVLWSLNMIAQNNDTATISLTIENWLSAGPVPFHLPAFHDQNNLDGKTFQPADLLKMHLKKIEKPVAGELFIDSGGNEIIWKKAKSGKSGNMPGSYSHDSEYAVNWQAVYANVSEWMEPEVKITTPQCFELYVDGKKKASRYSFTKNDKEPKAVEKQIKLEPGKHLFVIKSLYHKEENGKPWNVKMDFSFNLEENEAISFGIAPERFMDIEHLLLGQHLQSIALSPDGKLVMINFKEVYPPTGKSERWFVIKERETGNIVYTSEYTDINRAEWAPTGHQISFTAEAAGKNNFILLDLDTFEKKVLLENIKHFSGYQWSPKGDFIVYSLSEKPSAKKKDVYQVEGMPDRWPWWRNRSQLYQLNLTDLSSRRLTYGYLSNDLQDIRPDGQKLLISHSFPDFTARPYSRQVMMELNLTDLSVDTLWNQNYGGRASYSPDGSKLLVTGSPVMFGEKGTNVKPGQIPNDYDTQAYIYDLKTGRADAITREFNPTIERARWNPVDGLIYFLVEDRTYKKVFIYNPDNNQFINIGVKTDVVKNFDLASSSPWLAYTGTNISYPATGYIVNLQEKSQTIFCDPEKDFFADVRFGKTKDWDFKNDSGVTIEGRIYYPPDFDKNKKYPVIVYYYGGTSPTERSFRGRYPKNLFAAMGYIVYVLQPSGATGYGQVFSAQHVNNWGKTVADEIIKGTKLFIKDHPFVNPESVGCMGASYGGFMTMLLTTRTDIFSAAIAHAGISDISSYWGEGYWGYLYNSVASANSFPWNNRQMYVDQSPLFHADKVNTPLLLILGDADTNVPPGESIQMYTALKLLGKPVALVEVAGQNHHIVDYKKRIVWQKTILAWFDRWLKNQPGWWKDLYPEKDL